MRRILLTILALLVLIAVAEVVQIVSRGVQRGVSDSIKELKLERDMVQLRVAMRCFEKEFGEKPSEISQLNIGLLELKGSPEDYFLYEDGAVGALEEGRVVWELSSSGVGMPPSTPSPEVERRLSDRLKP